MNRGKFVVIDGLGKSGKTSAVQALKKELPAEKNVFTREPGGTRLAEEIREILIKGKINLSPLTHLLLFFAARRAHIEETILPSLEQGKNVICDRFDSSTDAYNLWGEEAQQLRFLFNQLREHVVSHDANPARYIILNVAPELAYERHQKSKQGTEKDKFDDKDLDFFKRVSQGFLEFGYMHKAIIIDANRPMHVVIDDVRTTVLNIIS